MNEHDIFETIAQNAGVLRLGLTSTEAARMALENDFSEEELQVISAFLLHMKDRRHEKMVGMLRHMSRIPLKNPKTFDNYDFSRISGRNAEALKNLSTLSTLHAHRNLAFIGPQGVGKTHLAMAYGLACCDGEHKAYFLKATELNQKLTEARRLGNESTVINSLVNPACLIIDEVGRCVFDRENTRMFFDIVDRRYGKEVPSNMVFTSNMSPDRWSEYFSEDSTLLCALDRIFDTASVYVIKGSSYRGQDCQTISLTAGTLSPLPNKH